MCVNYHAGMKDKLQKCLESKARDTLLHSCSHLTLQVGQLRQVMPAVFEVKAIEQTGLTDFLHPPKNSGSEIGSLRYDRMMFALMPLGGSLVILTPFCSTATGK